MYGIVITTAGAELLATLGAGETLTITRCMIGTGVVGSESAARELGELVQPMALATSTSPSVVDNNCTIMLEYRNDLNGGLDHDIEITEFGIFAQTGGSAEVLLAYGGLSDRPKPMGAYTGSAVEVQRFPVTFGVSDGEVVLGYSALAFMTAEDVEIYCTTVILPLFLEEVDKRIAAHNVSETAHPDIRKSLSGVDGRLGRLELQYSTDVSGNPWEVTFSDLEDVVVTGVWNQELGRMEF